MDLLVWDVDKLVALTRALTPEAIPLSQFAEIDKTCWYGSEGDEATCRSIDEHTRLVLDADLSPPIILCPEGCVMDGMHRVH